jgi:hypothetical protein
MKFCVGVLNIIRHVLGMFDIFVWLHNAKGHVVHFDLQLC